ncbi:CFI-box-CTERM domain-containing protein [Ruminococcus champanellensis]|uniref:CFI-box-CTERM domain-containing protein n=1 Tax=Ruminococcus champanellensis TaxID=1161942 RepID=UPI002E794300|nr:CFI-box-CTERM domain-containing protein [Ruminococcus champanellensis]MED9891881.1 CFI-box-CTERM domain-containing protein [Ruminococcus champanellensis]
MKCKVCGAESGKYPLCWNCNTLKEQGQIIKCTTCKQWHHKDASCPQAESNPNSNPFLYERREALLSNCEIAFFGAIQNALPAGFFVFPQINLAAFVLRTDQASYHNELFRNIDFLITDHAYVPKIAVEINDKSHLERNRHTRDQKIQKILEEAGIPLLTLWTSYGINQAYISQRITALLQAPVCRVHHFSGQTPDFIPPSTDNPMQPTSAPTESAPPKAKPSESENKTKKKQGCYIATCVYGSYDCPQVWQLRRFRDLTLRRSYLGRLFIQCYYAVSPTLVRVFGHSHSFRQFWRKVLNPLLRCLQEHDVPDSPYQDPE